MRRFLAVWSFSHFFGPLLHFGCVGPGFQFFDLLFVGEVADLRPEQCQQRRGEYGKYPEDALRDGDFGGQNGVVIDDVGDEKNSEPAARRNEVRWTNGRSTI